jgi:hypothetical protein
MIVTTVTSTRHSRLDKKTIQISRVTTVTTVTAGFLTHIRARLCAHAHPVLILYVVTVVTVVTATIEAGCSVTTISHHLSQRVFIVQSEVQP